MKSAVVKFLLIALLFSGMFFIQRRIDESKSRLLHEKAYSLRPPKSGIIKSLSLGHEVLVADIYWMRAIQYYAVMTDLGRIPEDLYYLSDFITDLDPRFMYAYYSTGLVLSIENGNHEHIKAILEKGKKALPDSWRIPFQLGIALYFLMEDYEGAADNLDYASKVKDYKPYAFLAARIRAEGGNPLTSISFLQSQLKDTKDEYWRGKITRHIQELWVSVHLNFLDEKLKAFHDSTGAYASQWRELYDAGIMKPSEMPVEPFGGKYIIDEETHRSDTTTDHKLFVYRPPQKVFKKW